MSVLLASSVAVSLAACLVLAAALVLWLARGRKSWLVGLPTLLLLLGTAGTVAELGQTVLAAASWFAVFPLLMAAYPDGKPVPRWSIVPVTLWIGLTAGYVATGGRIATEAWWAWLVFLTLLPTVGFQVYRYRRRATTDERESVRWVVLGAVIEFSAFAVVLTVIGDPGDGRPLAIAAANIAMLPIPAALVLGLISPRLVNVDPLLRVTVSVVSAGVFLALVFGVVLGFAGPWPAATILAAITIPTALGAQRFAHWLVHGRLITPTSAAAALQRRLDQTTPADDVAEVVVEQVREALRSDAVHLSGIARTPHCGERIPVTWHGEHIADLWVAPRRSETSLTNHDKATVAAMLNRAAPALRGSQALRELAQARAEVLRSREEERKRLRRDLHDELAPTLAGLGLGVSAIQTIASSDAIELQAVAEHVQQGIREAIEQIRNLTHGLRPAILDDHGLVEAVRQRMRILDSVNIVPHLRVRGDGPVPAAVELAAFLIVQEAVTNVFRHSGARNCWITITVGNTEVTISVEDDGIGITAVNGAGLGLNSMRDRAAEVGGRTTVTPTPTAGTRVAVTLPLVQGEPVS